LTETTDRARADIVFESAQPADAALGSEGYRMAVRTNGISIAANGEAGFDYAVQTLAQITARAPSGRLETRAVTVRDWPTYSLARHPPRREPSLFFLCRWSNDTSISRSGTN